MSEPIEGEVYLTLTGITARQVVTLDATHVRVRAYPNGKVVWRVKRSKFFSVYREQTPREKRERYWREQDRERRA